MSTANKAAGERSKLLTLAERDRDQGIKYKFQQDANRVTQFAFEIGELYVDFSKTHISKQLLSIYQAIAEEIGFEDQRKALFAGEKVNTTEQRPALHTLLRTSDAQDLKMADSAYLLQASQSRAQLHHQYHVLSQQMASRTPSITDIIHVGIGGFSLGPQLLYESMVDPQETRRIHFVSNIDGHQLQAVLSQCDAATTLVVGVSKTFSTAETLQNLDSIGSWFEQHGVSDYLKNFLAVTAKPDNAVDYGIAVSNIVSFPEWVGGRYSVWSSVSLSAILLLGLDAFEEFLSGAASIDHHFYQSAPTKNICFIAAALDHYYCNFFHAGSRAVFAYDYRLRSLVAYLQQLETESNGKDRQRDGQPVNQLTSPVVWGGVGTDVQHSVFQMLHQGTSSIPAEFLLVVKPDHGFATHHQELLANGLAQTAALLAGQDLAEVSAQNAGKELSESDKLAKVFSGDRPSTTLLVDQLSPYSLGALLAFYEHRTFCGGVLCNINSFDQMGVELGKRLATQVRPMLEDSFEQSALAALDPSTQALLRRVRKHGN